MLNILKTYNKIIIKLLFGFLIIFNTSCSAEIGSYFDKDFRKVKKFFKRINAREINSASSYIFPEDYANLYIFYEQFLKKNKVIDFQIIDVEKRTIDGQSCLIVKLTCNNCNESLLSYFSDRKKIINENVIYDTIYIRSVNEKDYLSFDWEWDKNVLSKNLKRAEVKAEVLNVRSGPGTEYPVIAKLEEFNEIIIDSDSKNPSWYKCFFFEKNGKVNYGFISSKFTEIEEISFFNLGWFGKLGLLTASIIALVVLIIIYPLMITTIFRSAQDSGTFGLILFGVFIAIVFLTYQIIENVIFELFLINLPF